LVEGVLGHERGLAAVVARRRRPTYAASGPSQALGSIGLGYGEHTRSFCYYDCWEGIYRLMQSDY
jgi:hypothetical protein